MPDELKARVLGMNVFQRKYCEYRAMGMVCADAAEKAGSTAKDRQARTRVGWNIENQNDGAKEYILWLQEQRARAAMVDNNEVIDMLRNVYREAMSNNKFSEANKAAELLGATIGMFAQGKSSPKGMSTPNPGQPSNDKDLSDADMKRVEAFSEEIDEEDEQKSINSESLDQRMETLQKLYRDLNRGKKG
jgi:hypothetical protein